MAARLVSLTCSRLSWRVRAMTDIEAIMQLSINVQRFKQLRAQKLWSQEELALASGVSLRTVQRLEANAHISRESLKAIAAALEVDATQMQLRDRPALPYSNLQFGWIIILVFLGISLASVVLLKLGQIPAPSFILLNVINAVILTLFSSLSTEVSTTQVHWHFSLGLISKTLALSDIKSVACTTSKLWWGLGLRLIPNGYLYSVGGRDIVAITLHDGRQFMLGSDRSSELARAIDHARANVDAQPSTLS